jgi:hypothetical protein
VKKTKYLSVYIIFLLVNLISVALCFSIHSIGYSDFGRFLGYIIGGAAASLSPTYNDGYLIIASAIIIYIVVRNPALKFVVSVVFLLMYQAYIFNHMVDESKVLGQPRPNYLDGFGFRLYAQTIILSLMASIEWIWRVVRGKVSKNKS